MIVFWLADCKKGYKKPEERLIFPLFNKFLNSKVSPAFEAEICYANALVFIAKNISDTNTDSNAGPYREYIKFDCKWLATALL